MEYWVWLNQIKGLGPIIGKRLLERFGSPKSIYESSKAELASVPGVGKKLSNAIALSRSLGGAYSIMEESDKKNINLLTYKDPLYPSIAKECLEAPMLLYYKGIIRENLEGVAVVGSRRCSNYGKRIAVEAGEFLAENDIPLVSGMAKGVDGYAQTACLKNGGYTIAFLGCGADICYPNEHGELMDAIAESGAVVSEHPPNTRPCGEFFPRRNALISAWSRKLLVVEASEKSGALITAGFSKKYKREVLAPPHEIYSITGKGANRLIAEGASIYLGPSQLRLKTEVIEKVNKKELSAEENGQKKDKTVLSPIEEKIVLCIGDKPRTIEEITACTGIGQADLVEHISIMELEGKIRAVAGGRFIGIRIILKKMRQ